MSTKQLHSGHHRPWTPLRIQEYLRWSIDRAPAPCREILSEFAQWLAEQRDSQPGTIGVRLFSARTFVTAVLGGARSLPEALGRLDVAGVEDHFVAYGQGHGPSARRQMQSAMRRFLEFSAERGWSDRRLAEAVPALAAQLPPPSRLETPDVIRPGVGARWRDGHRWQGAARSREPHGRSAECTRRRNARRRSATSSSRA
jgi:hypothetical protein